MLILALYMLASILFYTIMASKLLTEDLSYVIFNNIN